jgi:hypothetical protein
MVLSRTDPAEEEIDPYSTRRDRCCSAIPARHFYKEMVYGRLMFSPAQIPAPLHLTPIAASAGVPDEPLA